MAAGHNGGWTERGASGRGGGGHRVGPSHRHRRGQDQRRCGLGRPRRPQPANLGPQTSRCG